MNQRASRTTWRELALQAVLLLAVLAAVFPNTFLRGEMIAPGSILYELYPWKAHKTVEAGGSDRLILDAITAMDAYYALADRALKDGEWPLWNAYELAGMPLAANCQSAVFYPPRLLHAGLDLFVATTIYILLKLWLCGITAYLCARGMGMRPPAARLVSFGWMLSSYNLIWCYWPLPDVSAWIPLILLGIEFVLDARYRRGFFTLALGATLILLAGHPETAFAFGIGAGLYFLLRLLWERRWGRPLWLPLATAAGAWALALLVCSGQLLPFLEYLVNSYSYGNRAARDVSGKAFFEPGNLAAFWAPRFFGVWIQNNFWGKWNSNLTGMAYVGIPVWLALSLVGVRSETRVRGRAFGLFLSAVALCVLAYGAPPLEFAHRLPVFNTIYETYYIAWCVFALVILGGLGLDRWFERPRRLRELAWVLSVVALAVAVVGYVYWFDASLIRALKMTGYIQTQILIAGGFAALGVVILAVFCFWPRPALVGAALTVLLAVDLVVAVRGILATSPRDELFIRTDLTDYLLALDQPCRVEVSMGLIPGGIMPIYGIEQWTGYDGLYPERVLRFQKDLGIDLWKAMEPVCGVQYYLHDTRIAPLFPRDELGYFQRVASMEGIEVYKNTAAYPRAFLVGKARVVPDSTDMFAIMKRPDFRPRDEALLEATPAAGLPNAASQGLGTAAVTQRSSLRLTVEADAAQPAILVVTDAFYPGWKAYLDGAPAELFPVYYAFRGVSLPPGRHTVEFRYAPWTFRLGLWVSIATLVGTILYAARRLNAGKRSHAGV